MMTLPEPAAVAVPDERDAFEAKYKHLDLSRDRDAWMQEKYKHDAVSLAWDAWQARAALAAAPAAAEKVPQGVLDAARRAGMQLLRTADGYQLEKLSRIEASSTATPAAPAACPICFEEEPHTGTCGSKDPRALCNRAAAPVVLPEPDAAVREVMALVDALHGENVGIVKAITPYELNNAHRGAQKAREAIETKLRALLELLEAKAAEGKRLLREEMGRANRYAAAPAHTDTEIVKRTEQAARFLLGWKYGMEPEISDAQLRHSGNTKAQWAWVAACRLQEILTDSDAVNAAQEVDDAAKEGTA